MLDPRDEAVVVRADGQWHDVTAEVTAFTVARDRTVKVRLAPADEPAREFEYDRQDACRMTRPEVMVAHVAVRAEVDGVLDDEDSEPVLRFRSPAGDGWLRLFSPGDPTRYRTVPEERVRLLHNAADRPEVRAVLDYWSTVVALLDEDDPLRRSFESMRFVHPDSALARLLSGDPGSAEPALAAEDVVHPFPTGPSARVAVQRALEHPLSVVDAPPGTGADDLVLTLVADLAAVAGRTVAVVSPDEAAVTRVRDGLRRHGLAFVAATLGTGTDSFFSGIRGRNGELRMFLADAADAAEEGDDPTPGQVRRAAGRVAELQDDARRLAELRRDLAAYRVESAHLDRLVRRNGLPEIDPQPWRRRSADEVLRLLAEIEQPADGGTAHRMVRRVLDAARPGPLRHLDTTDPDVLLQVQRIYLARRAEELAAEVARREADHDPAALADREAELRALSTGLVRARLRDRYLDLGEADLDRAGYRRGPEFTRFVQHFPVLLSTCHALRPTIAGGRLLDHVILDDAARTDPLAAALALSCARHAVLVGDERTTAQPVRPDLRDADLPEAPHPALDQRRSSSLAAVTQILGDLVPRTLLREHSGTSAAIVEVSSRRCYGGQLVAVPEPAARGSRAPDPAVEEPLVVRVVPTGSAPGTEPDLVLGQVVPECCAEVPKDRLGIAAPYLRGASARTDDLLDAVEAEAARTRRPADPDTLVLTTVLGDGPPAPVDPRVLDAAVLRARRRLVLVTDETQIAGSPDLRDLVDHVAYQRPGEDAVPFAAVPDRLYRDYAGQRATTSAPEPADLVADLLDAVLAEGPATGLAVHRRVHLAALVPDRSALAEDERGALTGRTTVDLVVSRAASNRVVLVVEVDGAGPDQDDARRRVRDAGVEAVLTAVGVPVLRLPAVGDPAVLAERLRRAVDGLAQIALPVSPGSSEVEPGEQEEACGPGSSTAPEPVLAVD
jgi:hypothetical protein